MNARNHDAFRQPPGWRAAKSAHVTPTRRRNQYTPIIERPWFLFCGLVIVCAIVWARSQGWMP